MGTFWAMQKVNEEPLGHRDQSPSMTDAAPNLLRLRSAHRLGCPIPHPFPRKPRGGLYASDEY